MELILPELPVLAPADLMEFRAENATALKAFRRSMLRYAADLNNKIDGAELGDIEKITQFFVDTEIAPALDELRAASKKPGWKWMNRSINYLKIAPEIGAAYLAAGKMAAIAAAIRGASSQAGTDVQTSQGATKLLRKNGLYYLLKVSMTRTAPGR